MIAAVDVETSGLLPGFHEIMSLGIAPVDEKIPTLYLQVKPRFPERAEAKALEINGLNPADGLEESEVRSQVLYYLDRYKIGPEFKLHAIGQNFGGFDALFLQHFLGMDVYREHVSYRYRDLQSAAALLQDSGFAKFKSLKLNDICEALGVTPLKPHHALNDAIMERDAWVAATERVARVVRLLNHAKEQPGGEVVMVTKALLNEVYP